MIVQTHINAILDLPTMIKENAIDLRRLSDSHETFARPSGIEASHDALR